MDRIAELFEKGLANCTAEELTELRGLLDEQFDVLDKEPATQEVVAKQAELMEQTKAVMQAAADLEQAQADTEAAREAIRQERAQMNGEGDDETPAEDDKADEDEGDEPAGDEADAEAVPEPALVAAGVRGMARGRRRATPSPEAANQDPAGAVLTASNELRELSGQVITDPMVLAKGVSDRLKRMGGGGKYRTEALVASATWTLPADRQLTDDTFHNTRVMERISGLRARGILPGASGDALLASGGICQPVNVDYSVPTWATADRPIRDALPSYQATRGGVRYVQPPDVGALAGATEIWTEATDADPGSATKPVLQVLCGTEETVLVDAVPTRLQFGNMQSRFAPEQIAANMDLAVAAAARIAEVNLLNGILGGSVVVTTSQILGTTRDVITTLHQFVSAYRNSHRLPDSQTITCVLPAWAKDVIKTDLAREIGHSQNAYYDALAVPDEYVESLFRAAGVNPVWHIDGQSSAQLTTGGVTAPNQYLAVQTAGAINAFPDKIVGYVFAEGMWQFLDAGRLDLGVVRDSVLDSTNDYETFVETFEKPAYRGFTDGSYALVIDHCANGTSAGTIDTSSDCA